MKKFVSKCLFFFMIFIITWLFIFLSADYITRRSEFYSIDLDKYIVILGSSTASLSMNDKIISNSINLGNEGTSFYYKYFQIKKIIESNSHIKLLILDIPSHILTKKPEKWIYKSEKIFRELPKISSLLSPEDLFYVFKKDPNAFILSHVKAVFKNISFIAKVLIGKNVNYISSSSWGAYQPVEWSVTKKEIQKINFYKPFQYVHDCSEEINWVKKIVNIASNNNIKVFLIVSPYHELISHTEVTVPRNRYRKIISKQFPGVDFIDFSMFPLKDSEYANLAHLHSSGADKFSKYLDRLLSSDSLKDKYYNK